MAVIIMIYKLKGTVTSAIFIVLLLMLMSLVILTPMLSMIILGAVFAYGIRPIASRMEPYIKFKSVAIFIAMIIVILPLILILGLSINSVAQSAPVIATAAKNVDLNSINSTNIQSSAMVQQYLPAEVYPYINSFMKTINVELVDVAKSVTGYLLGFLESIPMIALELFIFFTSTFYLARDGDKIWKYLEYAIPEDRNEFFQKLSDEIQRVLKSIFFGHFLTAIIIGLMAGVGFYLLGYHYALFLGILAGFLQLIPVIGPWPTYTVLAIYDVLTGNYIRAVLVILFGIFLSASDIYIRPKISGKYADIHPLIFLLGFMCGPLVMGLVGFIIGPLILGVTYAAVITYKNEKNNTSDDSQVNKTSRPEK
ncbi:AI-2E family transporter [anaerobic digester metagenome]